ncbi:hypothetical protein [Cecembia lonarensis]|uniref:Uncharacterized protein n=1 Tax=Cecembia lonarensis (strain CCUG 58316 / KCTC 22772 / LW9) TaxID=1225176 RepID=K1LZX1_CECL9|nr:hypothetical protein [Cecembia lonarensis]EKB49654.1 hypothetical protein B879_01767 [Cecembia lonarensis LW9]
MKLSEKDIRYLEEKLVDRPFRWEELYFEIFDHVLCKYEASGLEDVEAFWEKEKSNWGWWKIYKMRVKFHSLTIWQFLKCYFNFLVSFKGQDLKINLLFLAIAFLLGINFYQNEAIMTGLILGLWFVYPVSFHAWIFHQGDTLGEKLKISNKGYTSAKLDANWSLFLVNLIFYQTILTTGKKYLGLEGFFSFAYYHPAISIGILFFMLLSARAMHQVYHSQLKPFLYEVK